MKKQELFFCAYESTLHARHLFSDPKRRCRTPITASRRYFSHELYSELHATSGRLAACLKRLVECHIRLMIGRHVRTLVDLCHANAEIKALTQVERRRAASRCGIVTSVEYAHRPNPM